MKKTIIFTLLLGLNSLAHAYIPSGYNDALNYIRDQETKLKQCALQMKEDTPCYAEANKNYDSLIQIIRAKYSDRIDMKLWQRINLGFKKQIDNCKSDAVRPMRRTLYYPYGECRSNSYHSFAVTTVELHLR